MSQGRATGGRATGGRLCLVTGASAGIGAALAEVYAAHGWSVALTARRLDRLETLAAGLRERHRVGTICIAADLFQPQAVDALLAAVAERGRVVDALVNNAGFGLAGRYASTAWADQRDMLQVLVVALAELAHKVLPGMLDRRFGRILNVASVAALIPGSAGHTLYGAAKSFVVKASESLHIETLGTGVHVTALCPGLTYSEFHDVNGTRAKVSELPGWAWSHAEDVAAAGYAAVEANRALCIPGAPNRALATLAKLIPTTPARAIMARQSNRFRKI